MRWLYLPFYALFCLFFPFCSCIARYAPFKKRKNILKKSYKNFKDINLDSFFANCKVNSYY